MREIKFRFWDKSRKKFTDYGAIHIDGNLMARSATFGGLYDFADEEMEESIIIQQYTGLKDRNGVEIYEGDVITQDGYTQHVQWSDMGAWWALVNIPNVHSGNHLSALDFDECEVIGNIYKNPELLERIESDE